MKNKIVFVDWNVLTHKAGFASVFMPMMSPVKVCFNMLLSNLKLVGLNNGDNVIIVKDGRNNWRKELDKSYKSTRKEKREVSKVNWEKLWPQFDNLLEEIEFSTKWNTICIDKLEADDVMAIGTKYFWDKDVIIITIDSDLQQLWDYNNVSNCCYAPIIYDNEGKQKCYKCNLHCEEVKTHRVKIFTPSGKQKGYKIEPTTFDANMTIMKKIRSEKTDDLVGETQNEKEFEIRKLLVDLLHLPTWIEDLVNDRLSKLDLNKQENYDLLPFNNKVDQWGKSFSDKIEEIYSDKYIVTYDESLKRKERKERLYKNKKKKLENKLFIQSKKEVLQ